MATVQHIQSPKDVPSGHKHVLVVLGQKDEIERQGENFTMTVNSNLSKNLFEAHLDTAIGDAKALADRERIDTVFVCKGRA